MRFWDGTHKPLEIPFKASKMTPRASMSSEMSNKSHFAPRWNRGNMCTDAITCLAVPYHKERTTNDDIRAQERREERGSLAREVTFSMKCTIPSAFPFPLYDYSLLVQWKGMLITHSQHDSFSEMRWNVMDSMAQDRSLQFLYLQTSGNKASWGEATQLILRVINSINRQTEPEPEPNGHYKCKPTLRYKWNRPRRDDVMCHRD